MIKCWQTCLGGRILCDFYCLPWIFVYCPFFWKHMETVSLPKISNYMYCILTLSDIVWKFWDEMAGLEEQRHVSSWILPLRVLHCPFILCLPSFSCLFIYSDIKERVQKALGFLYSILKDISPFMDYHYWVKSWHEMKLSVFWTKEVQMLIGIVCFACHHQCVTLDRSWIHAVTVKYEWDYI